MKKLYFNGVVMKMKILFDETYTSNDGKRISRNIWYGYADISLDGEYGKNINLNEAITK